MGRVSRLSFSTPPPNFHFWNTVCSHGWCILPPFSVDEDEQQLNGVLGLPGRRLARVALSRPKNRGKLMARLESSAKLDSKALADARRQIASVLRFDEDLSLFYRRLSVEPSLRWARRKGAGRMMRSPTVFEDVVKMICTTNCTWSQTTAMSKRLVENYGVSDSVAGQSFPTPQAIAADTAASFDRKIRAGYRSAYLHRIAKDVASGKIDLESLRTEQLDAEELHTRLRTLPGVGPYAAAGLGLLLGSYDRLALDTACRKMFAERHRRGRRAPDKSIERYYERFGRYRGLALWVELADHYRS